MSKIYIRKQGRYYTTMLQNTGDIPGITVGHTDWGRYTAKKRAQERANGLQRLLNVPQQLEVESL